MDNDNGKCLPRVDPSYNVTSGQCRAGTTDCCCTSAGDEEPEAADGVNWFMIIVLIVGGVMLCACIGFVLAKMCKKRKRVEPDWISAGEGEVGKTTVKSSSLQSVNIPRPKKDVDNNAMWDKRQTNSESVNARNAPNRSKASAKKDVSGSEATSRRMAAGAAKKVVLAGKMSARSPASQTKKVGGGRKAGDMRTAIKK